VKHGGASRNITSFMLHYVSGGSAPDSLSFFIPRASGSLDSLADVDLGRAVWIAGQTHNRLMFDRRDEGRTKTGKAAIGTMSIRTERLVTSYLATLGAELHPDAILFRNRSGNPYREDTLDDDFHAVRQAVFPGDKRRLMDMRRSGTLEAIAGGAEGFGLAAKMANSIDHSNSLHRTYAPVDEVRGAIARQAEASCREQNGGKVSPEQPTQVSPGKPRNQETKKRLSHCKHWRPRLDSNQGPSA